MSLYPSLEDMEVDKMAKAQNQFAHQMAMTDRAIASGQDQTAPPAYGAAYPSQQPGSLPSLYPSLEEYMGLSLTPAEIQANMPVVAANPQNMQVAQRFTSTGQGQIAPISGNSVGIQRAEIKQGIREVVTCKDADGKIGLRVRSVNKGIFVAFVHKDSPAALAGLRFGDQILQLNGETVAGWSHDKTMKFLTKAQGDRISFAIRDRPFERTISMQKDSAGTVGFVFRDNKITAIVKDSSAARNGVLIDHHMVEVNGQNVVGMKEKEIKQVFVDAPMTVTITIIPSFIYEHIVKSMGDSLLKKKMDHSIPDI